MAGEWDISLPVDNTLISDVPGEDRKITSKVKTVIQKEHRALGDSNSGGEHTQGSAMPFFLATASAPTTNPDGSAFATADLGRLWWDTTTKEMKILTAITPTWTVIPSVAAAITLLSTLTVTGAVTCSSTLDVVGNIDPTTYETTNGGFLDEDNMASDAADKVASQQSIKKYVDDKVVPQRARLYASGNQSISSAAITQVTLGGESYDPETIAASNAITPTKAGYYLVTGMVQCDDIVADSTAYIAYLYKDAASVAEGRDHPSLTVGIFSQLVSDVIYLNGSEAVTLRVSGDAAYTVIGGATKTYLSVHYLSA